MLVTCSRIKPYKDYEKVNKTFSEILTAEQIKKQYATRYTYSQIKEVLFFLEELGQTVSDAETTKKGKQEHYFYFDDKVKNSLLSELVSRGYKPLKINYKVPTYIKFYTLYQYDRLKFRKLLNKWLATDEGRNRTYKDLIAKQREFLEQCWVLDENKKRKRDCDEQHIYRYKTLHRILECIAQCLINNYGINTPDMIKYLFHRTNLVIYLPRGEEQEEIKPQAELLNAILSDIKTRTIIHLHLLKGLKKGLEIEEAVRLAYKSLAGFQNCHN